MLFNPYPEMKLLDVYFHKYEQLNITNMSKGQGIQYTSVFSDTDRGMGNLWNPLAIRSALLFPLIFQILWKHPDDSLVCLILNTFPLSPTGQKDL